MCRPTALYGKPITYRLSVTCQMKSHTVNFGHPTQVTMRGLATNGTAVPVKN